MNVAVIGIGVIALGACGGGSSGPKVASAGGQSASATGTGNTSKANVAKIATEYAQCARKNGMPNLPDPTIGDNGRPDFGGSGAGNAFRSAPDSVRQKVRTACRSILAKLPPPPPPTASELAARLKFAQCVRKNGVPNFPDPDPNGGRFFGGGGGGGGGNGNGGASSGRPRFDDPAFQKARQACQSLLPQGGRPGQ
jgi:hypothetical protein